MALLSDKDRKFLIDHFDKSLDDPVKLLFFTQTVACQFCAETANILEEVSALSDKISLETYNFVTDKEVAEEYGVDKIPAIAVMGAQDYGIRFFGILFGYDFTSLVEDIVDFSSVTTILSQETLDLIAGLEEPVHLQVFITPTCPYCPAAVRMAHSLAIASDKVTADMVESIEFPHLANKYKVQGVPRTIINEDTHLEGAAPEPLLTAKIQQALGLLDEKDVEQLMADMVAEAEGHVHQD